MRHIKTFENYQDSTKIYYRGGSCHTDHIWVTDDIEHASEYGRIYTYEMKPNLNILDVDIEYSKWFDLCEEYDEDSEDEEYKFQPNEDFIEFMKSKGYDGFQHETSSGNNIIIFDKNNLININ